jgi:hypothetical protein
MFRGNASEIREERPPGESLKIAIIETYYERFLEDFYAGHPEVRALGYAEHLAKLMAFRFSASDAFSHYFGQEGWEAQEIVFNDTALQGKWAREHGLKLKTPQLSSLWAKAGNVLFGFDWRFEVLKAQLKKFKPDVVLIKEQSLLTDAMVRELKSMTRLVAIQAASKLLSRRNYSSVDIAFTSFPHFVPIFEQKGLKAYFQKLCFDPRILSEIRLGAKKHEISFVGGVAFGQHLSRGRFLEGLSREFPLDWFGYSHGGRPGPGLKRSWKGRAWGLDMYQALADSNMTLNFHSDIAGPYANNVRLYEATGVGTCLVTDHKENLAEIFEPDSEIVTYRSAGECAEKLRYLRAHPAECEKIAKTGQARTLRDHTFGSRISEMSALLKNQL